MRRLTRWQVWLPCILLVGVLLLAAQFTADRLIRSSIVRTGKAIVGDRVELGGAQMSLARGQVTLHELRIADRGRPLQPLLRAESCQLDLGAGSLVGRQALVERGDVAGLEIRPPEDNAVWKPQAAEVLLATRGSDRQLVELTRQWFDHVEAQFDRDLVGQLESVRLADELVARWPRQSAQLRKRLEELKQRAAALEAGVDDAQRNPLRHAEFLRALPERVATLRSEFQQLADEIEKLPSLVEADRRAIISARRKDAEFLRAALRVDPIEPSALVAYLLADEAAGPSEQLVGWLRWMRQVMPADVPARDRRRQASDWRLKSLAVRGTAWVGEEPVTLSGTVTNLASKPRLCRRPAEVQLTTRGKLPMELTATIDRTQRTARDELVAHSDNVLLPEVGLGNADQLRLAVGRSLGSFSVRAGVEGEMLSGELQLVLAQPHVTPETSGRLGQLRLTDTLARSLDDVSSVTVQVSLAGTLDRPQWTIDSNLGPVVSGALDRALIAAAEQRSQELLTRSQRHVDEQLARLDRQMADEQARLLPQLAGRVHLLDRIAQAQQPPTRLAPDRVGRRLPDGSLFR